MYGRRLILDPMLSSREIRGCLLNFPIQASGADVLKLTMLNIWQEHPKWLHLIGSVHDEMLAIVRPAYVTQAKALLREAAADATRRECGHRNPDPAGDRGRKSGGSRFRTKRIKKREHTTSANASRRPNSTS
jgi:hypothetical protein